MGKISGCVEAKCTDCDCVFVWHCDNHPFIHTKMIGRCDNCIDGKKHKCRDEFEDIAK
jgi:hypothetical protein